MKKYDEYGNLYGSLMTDEESRASAESAMAQNHITSDAGANFDRKLKERGISFVAPSAFERGDQAGSAAVAMGASDRFAEMEKFIRTNPELQYQRESAGAQRDESALGRVMDIQTARGVHPNLAAKLSVDQIMGRDQPGTQSRNPYMSTSRGIFNTGDESIVPGTAPIADPTYPSTGPQGPAVQAKGMWAAWNAKTGRYESWKPITQGVDVNDISDPVLRDYMIIQGKGGGNALANLPQFAAPAGGQEYSQEDVDAVRLKFPDYDDARVGRYLQKFWR